MKDCFYSEGGVLTMADQLSKSNMLKCTSHTIFFDIKQTKTGNNYLRITESRYDKKTKQSTRNSFVLFKEDMEGFIGKLQEIKL